MKEQSMEVKSWSRWVCRVSLESFCHGFF